MSYYSHTIDSNGVTVHFDALEFLRSKRTSFSSERPWWGGNSPRQNYDGAVNLLQDLLSGVGISLSGTIGPIPLPPVPGAGGGGTGVALTPESILEQIVDGINAAEDTLNSQNFVIASGTVRAQLNLPFASAEVSFEITPKPYN